MIWREPEPGAARSPARPWALALLAVAAGALTVGVLLLTGVIGGDGGFDAGRIAEAGRTDGSSDPFAWEPDRNADFERRAALGLSHVLYDKSPGGIVASARRTARWRDEIEAAATAHGADPDVMEAMVLLESAGRPEVIAGDDPEAASGLAQIVAGTATDLLDMRVDLARSRVLTRQIGRIEERAAKAKEQAQSKKPKVRAKAREELRRLPARERALRERRAEVDERFDPAKALDGMARYLAISEERFGRSDLATTSYHMGIGNLENVIAAYREETPADDPGYGQLFFDSSPLRNAAAWKLLASFGDDSSTYLWRVLAAQRIMDLYRDDRAELDRLATLQDRKATQEEVFHPESETEVFATPDDIQAALDDGTLLRLPQGADYGYTIDKRMGELAPNLGPENQVVARSSLYRALRPEALATLIYMTSRVREINGDKGVLNLTSTVRDQQYQDALTDVNDQATSAYSLHTTGWSFDIERKYSSDRQAEAFQFMLDRLRALDVIDYAYEPDAIHITVSNEAKPLLDS